MRQRICGDDRRCARSASELDEEEPIGPQPKPPTRVPGRTWASLIALEATPSGRAGRRPRRPDCPVPEPDTCRASHEAHGGAVRALRRDRRIEPRDRDARARQGHGSHTSHDMLGSIATRWPRRGPDSNDPAGLVAQDQRPRQHRVSDAGLGVPMEIGTADTHGRYSYEFVARAGNGWRFVHQAEITRPVEPEAFIWPLPSHRPTRSSCCSAAFVQRPSSRAAATVGKRSGSSERRTSPRSGRTDRP